LLFIFPSIYPESITEDNINILFGFLHFDEFKFHHKNIKILTTNEKIIELLNKNDVYRNFAKVPNYYEGVQSLNVDFDKNKSVPIQYLKADSSYVYDLYDDEGDVRIPALSKITEEMKQYLINSGLSSLTYYSDGDIDEITTSGDNKSSQSQTLSQFEFITSETEEVSDTGSELAVVNDRINMFLNKLKGHSVLVISDNSKDIEIIKNSLESYVTIDVIDKKADLEKALSKKNYILALLDHHLTGISALTLLQKIRNSATRRKMSVIIIAKNMNKLQLTEYKKYGTDYILLTPFNTTKLIFKVFNSITMDRKS
ncbi:MAG TPA: response regulator, partial [Spirochaetota bacterium]|nr:response regulator [Spirochaetota bacterium]